MGVAGMSLCTRSYEGMQEIALPHLGVIDFLDHYMNSLCRTSVYTIIAVHIH